ncbi:MAG: hypothetical protein H7840_01585 [Alphaproteobacteria bacterium]
MCWKPYELSTAKTGLVYDPMVDRYKHCGQSDQAEVVMVKHRMVGLCPRDLTIETAQQLLDESIEEFRETRPERPVARWNVHKGVVYQARPSDWPGRWHGYPVKVRLKEKGEEKAKVRGKIKIPSEILTELRARAASAGHEGRLEEWLES